MLARSILVGMIEIDETAGEMRLFRRPSALGVSLRARREECADSVACAVLMADLPRLHDELDADFRRLHARLAA
jgi:hypothetical protein